MASPTRSVQRHEALESAAAVRRRGATGAGSSGSSDSAGRSVAGGSGTVAVMRAPRTS